MNMCEYINQNVISYIDWNIFYISFWVFFYGVYLIKLKFYLGQNTGFPHFHDSEIPWLFLDFPLTFNWFFKDFLWNPKHFMDNLNNVRRFCGF